MVHEMKRVQKLLFAQALSDKTNKGPYQENSRQLFYCMKFIQKFSLEF